MNLVSSALPAINPALFAEPATAPQELTLPVNFWTLLLAPPSDAEVPATEQVDAVVTTQSASAIPIKVASPQQIAQALIRSMLTPVAPIDAEPEHLPVGQNATEPAFAVPKSEAIPMEKVPKKEPKQQELSEPLTMPVLVATPGIPPPIVRAPQPDQMEIPERAPLQMAPAIPAEITSSKASSDAPVAFELRLTPATAEPARSVGESQPVPSPSQEVPAPEHPRVQRAEASTFEHKSSRENPPVPMPAPVKHDQVAAEFQTVPAQREITVNHAVKSSVPEAPAAQAPIETPRAEAPTTPVRDLAMRVSTPDSPSVDVRVSERGGEVHVAVRTADPSLQTSLQSDLGSLVGKLEQSGFRTEAIIPEPTHHLSENNITVHALSTHSTADLSGSGTYGESQDPRRESGNHGSSSGSRDSDRQQQQQQHRRSTRAWEEMMEEMQ